MRKLHTVVFLVAALTWGVVACSNPFSSSDSGQAGPTGPTVPVQLRASSALEGVSGVSAAGISALQDANEACDDPIGKDILSGAPDRLVLTLQSISLDYSSPRTSTTIWSGEHDIELSGASLVLDEISAELDPVPVGTISRVRLRFSSEATIRGTVSGCLNISDDTVEDGYRRKVEFVSIHTRSGYTYEPRNESSGAESYTVFMEGEPEDMTVHLTRYSSLNVSYEQEIVVSEEDTERLTLTLFFDLNRVLRFFSGEKYAIEAPEPDSEEYQEGGDWDHGVNPGDPSDRAYFFGHSLFPMQVFAGEEGRIEGYETLYTVGGTPVQGWMSLVFDPDDNLLAGELIGDDDNDFTVAKGTIKEFDYIPETDTINFFYDLDGGSSRFYIEGFKRLSSVGDAVEDTHFRAERDDGNAPGPGTATFTLRLVR